MFFLFFYQAKANWILGDSKVWQGDLNIGLVY